jgi:hypothetical protein
MNGWYEPTRSFVNKLPIPKLMEYARECYGLDLDDDIEEIREQVFEEMSRKKYDT